jgi:hypothetical protein
MLSTPTDLRLKELGCKIRWAANMEERSLSHALFENGNSFARADKTVFRIRVTNPGSPAISVQAVWNK